ncbi:MAG: hypothetical protein V1784_11205 [bacterium]
MKREPLYTSKSEYGSGAHAIRVDVGRLSIWYSYDTVVAIQDGNGALHVSENCWSTTTGKHLNAIDDGDKKSRVPRADFELIVSEILRAHNLQLGAL